MIDRLTDGVPPGSSNDDAYQTRNPGVGEDLHYIQQDDYFVSDQPLGGNNYIYVSIAKMVKAPSSSTKGEGQFFKITDGNPQWTRYYWKSQPAMPMEMRLGTPIIIFEGNLDNGVYQPPLSKESARSANWFMAKITDLSDRYRGYLTVSGGYKVGLKNIRQMQ